MQKYTRNRFNKKVVLSIFLVIFLNPFFGQESSGAEPKELRMLAWVGYDEPEFIVPLERVLGLKIRVKTYVGGDQMYSLFRAAPPGTYDIVVVDAEYGKKMYEEGLLTSISPKLWKSQDLFEPFSRGDPVRVADRVYGAVVRWGALGLVYNREHISVEQANDYGTLWDPKLKGRVGIFDWYLPNMGVLSRYLGNNPPYSLNRSQLDELRTRLLELRTQVRAIHPNTGDVIADLRQGDAWITPGIGEWAAAVLAEEGKPIDWSVPRQGGVMWVEALTIPAAANNKRLAKRLVDLVRTPEHMARLAWRKAYHSQVPRRSAYERMPAEQRRLLKAENLNTLQDLVRKLSIRQLPGPQTTEVDWLNVWSDFKSGISQ